MKTYKISCLVFSFVFVFAGAAMAIDYVDVGLPSSEAFHNMQSWGPIEPLNSGGNYGGINHCRAIWSTMDNSINAFITMNFSGGNEALYFRHLEGMADDGFEVWVGGVLRYTHFENTNTEQWVINFIAPPFPSGAQVVEFVATGPAWPSWQTYGQVCFAEIWVGTDDPVALEEGSWGDVKALFR